MFVSKGIKGVSGLLVAWLLAEKYGAYGSGLFFIAYSFAFICANFAQLGIGNACLSFIPQVREQESKDISSLWTFSQVVVGGFSFLFSATVMFFAKPVAELVFKDVSKWAYVFWAAPIIFAWSLTRINIMVRQSMGDMSGITVLENLVHPLGMMVLVGLAFVADLSVLNFLIAVTALYVVVFVYALLSTRHDYALKLSLKLRSHITVREIVLFSIPLLVIAFSQTSLIWINTLILGAVGAVADAAVFVAAMKIAFSISILLYTFNSVYAPQISAAHARNDMQAIPALYRDATHALTFFSFILLVGVAAYADLAMGFFGAEYEAGTGCLLWMLAGQLSNCYVGPVGYMLILSGKSKLEVFNTSVGLVLNAGLCVVLYNFFGVSGAGAAFCLSSVIINLFRYFQCRKFFGVIWFDITQRLFISLQLFIIAAYLLLTSYGINRELLIIVLLSAYLLLNYRKVWSLVETLRTQH